MTQRSVCLDSNKSYSMRGKGQAAAHMHGPHLNHRPFGLSVPPTAVGLHVAPSELQIEDCIQRLFIGGLCFCLTTYTQTQHHMPCADLCICAFRPGCAHMCLIVGLPVLSRTQTNCALRCDCTRRKCTAMVVAGFVYQLCSTEEDAGLLALRIGLHCMTTGFRTDQSTAPC